MDIRKDWKIGELKTVFFKTKVHNSCGATLNGQHWIIGGGNDKRQVSDYSFDPIKVKITVKVSRIDGCNVKRVGKLPVDFSSGACNTYQFDVEKILFCFGEKNGNSQCQL